MKLFSPLPQGSVWERYTVALATAVLAILLRALLEPLLGHAGFFATVYIAVIFSAIVCGLWPSIMAAVVSTVGVMYWVVDPLLSLRITDPRDIHALIACAVVCPALIAMGEANRRKQLRLDEAHARLEQRVAERTAELSQALANLKKEIEIRERAQEELRQLSFRLMTVQDEQRRHIARELHDSAGQTLSAMKMFIADLERQTSALPKLSGSVKDLDTLVSQLLQEIRTTSYLLHPPLLDELGFGSAAKWFVEGFTKRSGINVRCEVQDEIERLPDTIELTLFRVLQESLTNIHRHSGATTATVRFAAGGNSAELQISDNGRGLSAEQLKRFRESVGGAGVGLTGMRERLRNVGGDLKIESNGTGTTIRAVVAHVRTQLSKNTSTLSVA